MQLPAADCGEQATVEERESVHSDASAEDSTRDNVRMETDELQTGDAPASNGAGQLLMPLITVREPRAGSRKDGGNS